MLIRLLMPGVLLSLCVMVHALVVTALLRRLSRSAGQTWLRFWSITWVLIRVALWMVAAHLVEIAIWASFFCVAPDVPRHRDIVVFQRRDVHYCRIRRPRSAGEVAVDRRCGRTDGNIDVRLVHWLPLCRCQQDVFRSVDRARSACPEQRPISANLNHERIEFRPRNGRMYVVNFCSVQATEGLWQST